MVGIPGQTMPGWPGVRRAQTQYAVAETLRQGRRHNRGCWEPVLAGGFAPPIIVEMRRVGEMVAST